MQENKISSTPVASFSCKRKISIDEAVTVSPLKRNHIDIALTQSYSNKLTIDYIVNKLLYKSTMEIPHFKSDYRGIFKHNLKLIEL